MSEEKLFDVNWDQRKWETPASAQDMKLYSYPPRTIRNMSVPGFLTWLVLLLASIGGLLYTAWMTVTGDYEDGKVNTILGVVSFVVLLCCLIYKTNYKRKLITYTDVLHAVLIDNAKHAYVVHLNMEGQALQAYMDEYEKIVKTIYSKLNVNLGDFSQQLESVCQQFENLDDDMKTQLS